MSLRYLSVCSGIEAATAAWHPLGWEPVAFSEVDAFPSAVLTHHYPAVPNWGDMTKFQEWPNACRCLSDRLDEFSVKARQSHDRSGQCERSDVYAVESTQSRDSDRAGNGATCEHCGGTVIDVLVGGTPCQSFSVAGLRKGLDDPRGSLMLVYLAIARRYRPRWVVWENVPGVLSADGGRAFGSLLGGLAELGYGFAYRVLDAQYFGVAQRRRRVFVVGHLGDWRRAAAVLFERASLSGHPAPRREAGQVAPAVPARRTGGGGLSTDFDCDGGLIPHVANLTARMGKGINTTCDEGQTMVAHSLRSDGFDPSEDGTGRGTPLVPIAFTTDQEPKWNADQALTLTKGSPSGGGHPQAVAFDARQSDVLQYGDRTCPLDTDGSSIGVMTLAIRGRADGAQLEVRQDGTANAVLTPSGGRAGIGVGAVAFDTTQITSAANYSNPKPGGPCHPLASTAHPPAVAYGIGSKASSADADVSNRSHASGGPAGMGIMENQAHALRAGRVGQVAHNMAVRRLTPMECERLQGFPDDYTLIPYRGKPAADGPRYKALGNSMAVPCMSWIGERIAQVEAL